MDMELHCACSDIGVLGNSWVLSGCGGLPSAPARCYCPLCLRVGVFGPFASTSVRPRWSEIAKVRVFPSQAAVPGDLSSTPGRAFGSWIVQLFARTETVVSRPALFPHGGIS